MSDNESSFPDGEPIDPIDPIDPQMAEPDLGPLTALLGDAQIWEEPDPGLEDAVLAAVRSAMAGETPAGSPPSTTALPPTEAEASPIQPLGLVPPPEYRAAEPDESAAGTRPIDDQSGHPDPVVVPIDRPRRRWVGPLLGAAAALVLVAAVGLASLALRDGGPDLEVALAGTELAPEAEAVAQITNTPQGTRLEIDPQGLPPAPPGQYYEAWLRQSPEVGVTAGTFHLRGGEGPIELWSGVTVDRYPLITVTIQDEGAGAESSGRVVLSGRVAQG